MALISERISLYHSWVGKVEDGNREESYHGNIGTLTEQTGVPILCCNHVVVIVIIIRNIRWSIILESP